MMSGLFLVVIVLTWAMFVYGFVAKDHGALNLSVLLAVVYLVVALVEAFS